MQTQDIGRMQRTVGARSPIAAVGLSMLLAMALLLGLTVTAFAADDEAQRIVVNYGHNWVEVWSDPSVAVNVTVDDKAEVTGMTNEDGWFASYEWSWTPDFPSIVPGDIVNVSIAGVPAGEVEVGEVESDLDFDDDIVSGKIHAPWLSPTLVQVRCEIWEDGGPEGIQLTDVDPDGGSFTCDFSTKGWDLKPDQMIAVRYIQPDGHEVIGMAEAPWVRVDYGHAWVGANYQAGHTFTITLTDSSDAVKAVAEVESVYGGGWGGDGFQTQGEDWQPEHSRHPTR